MKTNNAYSEDFKKIISFLEEKDLTYIIKNENTIEVPYEIEGRRFVPTIQFNGIWLVVLAKIVPAEDLPTTDETYLLKLYKRMLVAIHKLPEINFDIDEDGAIYTSVDMRTEITDYDNFHSEFHAIPNGIKYFIINIAEELDPKIPVKGFPEEA
ncbi:hypothetical protein GF325_17090 [Candidatus Bathyarchaeota archaeon]|nr:hypothetical protein [Candidatus Bathyarchaeota archaeon]